MRINENLWKQVVGASFTLALFLTSSIVAAAECNQLRATTDKPALLTVSPQDVSKSDQLNAAGRIVLKVTCFQPAKDGSPVQAIVKAQRADGKDEEVYRFAVFPQAEFKAGDGSNPQVFSFSLPKDIASGGSVSLKVELVPLRGEGEGANLEIGGAEWETSR